MVMKLEDYTLDEIVNLGSDGFITICKQSTVGTLKSTKVVIECKYTEMEKVRNALIDKADTIEDKDHLGITLNTLAVALQKLEDCASIINEVILDKTKPRN